MKDEIKEILDRLKEQYSTDIKLGKEIANDFAEYKLNYREMSLLLDYITNLQKEVRINNDLIPYLKNKEKSLKKQITNLQEENKELKKKITFNEKSRRKMQQTLMEQIEDYKSRNEKAIEYMKSFGSDSDRKNYLLYFNDIINKSLNILQGSDKNE